MIKRGKLFYIFGAFFLALPGLCSALAADLTGTITMPDGNSSKAIILIEYAKSKSTDSGPYPNVPVHVQTDAHGHFTIQSLDADWRYSGYVIALGCKLHQFLDVDPAAGPLNISLETAQHTNTASGTILRGRVVDLNGQPIPSALIQMQEVTRNDTTYSGPIDIDHYSICDDAGNFTVYATTPFTNAGGAAEAPGFSTGLFEGWTPVGATNDINVAGFTTGLANHWTPNNANHELTLVGGASLEGSWSMPENRCQTPRFVSTVSAPNPAP
ncbi:MAG: hypothetical protein ACLQSR_10440 [Limisphaerales bacterium]